MRHMGYLNLVGTPYVCEHHGQGARGCGDPTAGTHTAFSSTLGRGDGQP